MGRGNDQNVAAASSISMRTQSEDNGEIASLSETPLQAESLSDMSHAEQAREFISDDAYGDDFDEQAINNIVKNLRKLPQNASKGHDYVTEQAEDLFARCCQTIENGADREQVAKIANLFGVSQKALVDRLA